MEDINKILSDLLSGEINKKETEEKIKEHFSSFNKLHQGLKEGDKIIYKGNSGILIKKGERLSTIEYYILGYVVNENSTKRVDVYNIEFYKEPKNYWN